MAAFMKNSLPEKLIEVGCAIIRHQGRILIAQRKAESYLGGYWEFPGGKREAGETIEECLIREVREELGVTISPHSLLKQVRHTYPEKDLLLDFWFCDWVSGEPARVDCQDFRWITPEKLSDFKFPPADDDLIRDLILHKNSYFLKSK